MSNQMLESSPNTDDPHSLMERNFILEYLKGQGHTFASLHKLPAEQIKKLLTEASIYASTKLTEIEARAKFVDEIHGTVASTWGENA